MTSNSIIKHSFSNLLPDSNEIAVGEIVLQLSDSSAVLYTKGYNGEVIQIGKGAQNLGDLLDIDLTNVKEGSFLVKQGNKFVASNFVGSFTNLVDVEVLNPVNGQYLRYDSLFQAYKNFNPSYSMWQLTDVNLPDPTVFTNISGLNNQVLVYNSSQGKFIPRTRINTIALLDDVALNPPGNANHVLVFDTTSLKWTNKELEIKWDTSPELGGNLDGKTFSIINSSYRAQVINITNLTPTINLNYNTGDYFIINGTTSSILNSCIINPVFTTPNNSTAIMMLEIRQSTGAILIGGLTNIRYEDGKPIQLSGSGKTDLITITNVKSNGVETNYITSTALNLATLGNGGTPSYRYDKNRYPTTQGFSNPNLYDDYWKYVVLYLNFEPQVSTGRLWYQDKSDNAVPISTTALNLGIPIYTFGLQESVAQFDTSAKTISINPSSSISLPGDFTIEFFINYPNDTDYMNSVSVNHTYFSNSGSTFRLRYTGAYGTSQDTMFQVDIGGNSLNYKNAYNYFQYRNNRYIHVALVRLNTQLYLFVDGTLQSTTDSTINNPITNIIIDNSSLINIKGLLNSFRITNGIARYTTNFKIPDMRFGLVGGAENILKSQVFDYYMNPAKKKLSQEFFC